MTDEQKKELFQRTARIVQLIIKDELLLELARSVVQPEFAARLRSLVTEAEGVVAIAEATR